MTTNADGVYQFRQLPPGNYTLQVLFRDAHVKHTVEVAAGLRVGADFRVSAEARPFLDGPG